MAMQTGKLLIAQGGGPTAVINQSLVGVVLAARDFPVIEAVYGARHGVRGIVDQDFIDLSKESAGNLEAVAATVDGFALSRLDLEQRREGNVLGAAQAGRKSGLKMLTLLRDEELIVQARMEAQALVDADPRLAGHPALVSAIRALLDEEQAKFLEKA